MAKISNLTSYPLITNLDKDDYVLITDKENAFQTKNVSIEKLQTFLAINTNTASVSISAADLLTSYATAVDVIAAPGVNKVLDIISMTGYMDAGTTVFDFVAAAQLNIGVVNFGVIPHTTFLNSATDVVVKSKLLDGVTSGIIGVNSALVFKAQTQNPTQGNGVLYLDIMYRTLEVGSSF